MDLLEQVRSAMGSQPVDLLLKNGRLVNVFSGTIDAVSVAVHRDVVVGFGDYDAIDTIELNERFLAPGFVDGHLHLESSMLSLREFARNVVPRGTTTVVADPHEIANVLGVQGINYILESSAGLPLRVCIMFPSCVPATPFETSGAVLTHTDMIPFRDNARVLGLAEMMNYPGLLSLDPEIFEKIAVFKDKVKDGHAPGLTGKSLCAYVAAGIGSDHECTTLDEAREKLQRGMRIMIRQGSAAKNLEALLPVVNEDNSRNCFFVTDDLDPHDILGKGHIDNIVRMAISMGVSPMRAIQMATINPASYFGLKNLGAILPGYTADMIVFDDLDQLQISSVFAAGRLVADQGQSLREMPQFDTSGLPPSVNVAWDKVGDFCIPAEGGSVNIIQVVPDQIITHRVVEKTPALDGNVVADPARDILKMAVIERHRGTGNHAIGLIRGFGLKSGAVCSTVAHDSHNIIVVGANEPDMKKAAQEAAVMGGGMVVVNHGEVLARLPLPIAGLMSDKPIDTVVEGLDNLVNAAKTLGCFLEHPFATLSFMALTPIPEIKLTDQGLFDSVNFKFISLFET